MNLYESFAQATQLGDLHTCLMMDMKACQEDDVRLLCHLTPSIYTEVSAPAAPALAGRPLPPPRLSEGSKMLNPPTPPRVPVPCSVCAGSWGLSLFSWLPGFGPLPWP